MSATIPCTPCCSSTPTTTNIPGSTGASAVTTASSFVLPAIGGTVTITVGDSSWIKVGKNLFISDGSKLGNFVVTGVNSSTSITARFLGLVGDSASGTVADGAIVLPGMGNQTPAWDLDALTALTDNSAGVAADTIAATVAKSVVFGGAFKMADLANASVWGVAIPYAFKLISVLLKIDVAVTTGAKAATLTARVNASNCTGGVISAAGTYAAGGSQAGTSITGTNTGTAGQIADFVVSGVTAFTEGSGHLEMVVLNTDLAATIAALAAKMNQLRTALRHQ